MLVKTYSAAVNGLEVTPVTIEVSLNKGVMYHLTGLGDEAVREGRRQRVDSKSEQSERIVVHVQDRKLSH